jgi:hypothetical protein
VPTASRRACTAPHVARMATACQAQHARPVAQSGRPAARPVPSAHAPRAARARLAAACAERSTSGAALSGGMLVGTAEAACGDGQHDEARAGQHAGRDALKRGQRLDEARFQENAAAVAGTLPYWHSGTCVAEVLLT